MLSSASTESKSLDALPSVSWRWKEGKHVYNCHRTACRTGRLQDPSAAVSVFLASPGKWICFQEDQVHCLFLSQSNSSTCARADIVFEDKFIFLNMLSQLCRMWHVSNAHDRRINRVSYFLFLREYAHTHLSKNSSVNPNLCPVHLPGPSISPWLMHSVNVIWAPAIYRNFKLSVQRGKINLIWQQKKATWLR